MKILSVALAALLMAGALGGCVTLNFSATGYGGAVRGEGEMTEVSFPVESYTKLVISNSVNLVYSAQPSDSITLSIQPNLAEYLTVESRSGTLYIGSDVFFETEPGKMPVLYVGNPDLAALQVSGLVEMSAGDPITGDAFELNVSGLCDIDCAVQVGSFTASNSGAGSIRVRGNADKASIHISGAGDIEALALQTREASISINGVGDASISCSDALEVNLSGLGSLRYRGSPAVSQRISGLGEIKQVD